MSRRADSVGRPELPLHVRVWGEGSPLVFLHGFGASSFTWRRQAVELAKEHRVVLVDLKGFGMAPKPDDAAYGPLDQAELVAELVVRRGLAGVTLVGHSLGGAVALLATLLLRDRGEHRRVGGIVNMAGPAYRQPFPRFVGLARHRRAARLLLGLVPPEWIIDRALRSVVYDPGAVTESQVRAYAAPLAHPDGRRAVVEAATRLLPHDLDRWVSRYREIDVPVLLVWGRADPVVPVWVGERLARELPGAELVLLDECGHITPEERPEKTLALIRDFLARTTGPGASRAEDERSDGETGAG